MDVSTQELSPLRAAGSERLGSLSGIIFVAILLAGVLATPTPPQPGDASTAIRSYYDEHADAVLGFAYLQALAAVFFLLFVCMLARLLEDRGGAPLASQATLASGVLVLAATLAGTAVFGALGFGVAAEGDPALARALFDLGNMALNVGDFMLAVVVGVPSLVALRGGLLPRWTALFGLAVAAGWAVAGVSILVREGFFAGPNGPYGMAVLVAFLGWVLATSAALYRRARRTGAE